MGPGAASDLSETRLKEAESSDQGVVLDLAGESRSPGRGILQIEELALCETLENV